MEVDKRYLNLNNNTSARAADLQTKMIVIISVIVRAITNVCVSFDQSPKGWIMYQIGWTNLNKVAKGVLSKLHVPPNCQQERNISKSEVLNPKVKIRTPGNWKKLPKFPSSWNPNLHDCGFDRFYLDKLPSSYSAWIEDTFGLVNSPTLNPPCLMTSLHSGPYTFPRANGFIVEVHVLSCGWPIAWGWFHQTQQPQ